MKTTWKPLTAGILNIILGTLLLTAGVSFLGMRNQPVAISMASYVMQSMGLSGSPDPLFINRLFVFLTAIAVFPGMLSLLGGIYATKRRAWGLALAASISTLLFSFILGIPAIICTALSKEEFARH